MEGSGKSHGKSLDPNAKITLPSNHGDRAVEEGGASTDIRQLRNSDVTPPSYQQHDDRVGEGTSTNIDVTPTVLTPPSTQQQDEDLAVRERGGATTTGKTGTSSIGLTFAQMCTLGRRRLMEDVMAVEPIVLQGEDYMFSAVYDGHNGSKVAEMCGQKLHTIVENQVRVARLEENNDFNWENVMKKCFRIMDEEFQHEHMMAELEGLNEKEKAERKTIIERMCSMGSTATVVLLGMEEIIVSNCGDSRAVLSRGGIAMPLTVDHKPDRADERERIEAAGGIVAYWDGWRVGGVLATSRSLGDEYLKPYVSSEPEVTVMRRSEQDDFLIIATDGLFDVLSNKSACAIVKKALQAQHRSLERRVGKAAASLIKYAMSRGSQDNISAIVVRMKK